MRSQVLSIKQMQELIKLGVNTSKASMFWHPAFYRVNGILDFDRYEDIPRIKLENNCDLLKYDILTFTLQDILEMLPKFIDDKHYHLAIYPMLLDNLWFVGYDNIYGSGMALHAEYSKDCLMAAFNMLKWVRQNNYI